MNFGKMSKAELEQYLLENPFDVNATRCLSNCYTTRNEKAGLWEYFTMFNPRNFDGFLKLVYLYQTPEEKEAACLRFMRNTPGNFSNHLKLAKLSKINSATFLSEYMYNVMFRRGEIMDCDDYANLKDMLLSPITVDQDIETLKQNVRQHPNNFIESRKLATAYNATGDIDNEALVWLQFIEKNKNNILGYFEFASIGDQLSLADMVLHYYDKYRDNNLIGVIGILHSTEYFEHVSSLPDTLKGCMYRQAWCCIDHDYDSAAKKWQEYLRNDPYNYYALRNCGECFANSGDAMKANRMYKKAFAAAADRDEKNKVIEKQRDLLRGLSEGERAELEQQIEREVAQLNPQQQQQEVAQLNPQQAVDTQVREQVGAAGLANAVGQKKATSEKQVQVANAGKDNPHNAQRQIN